ncbi:MAG: hypothetical protein ABH873_09685 [Candidatus Firestonebacteria bacterium]
MNIIMEKMKSNENTLLFHAFICSFGLLKIIWRVSTQIAKYVFPNISYELNDWVVKLFFHEKRYELFGYAITITAILIFYLLFYLRMVKISKNNDEFHNYITANNSIYISWFIIILIVNIVLVLSIDMGKTVKYFLVLLWVALSFLPFYIESIRKIKINKSKINKYYYILFSLILIIIIIVFSPFVFIKLKIINEYFDIPEETLMGNKYINNSEYINKNNIFIDHNKYNLEVDKASSPAPKQGTYINISKTNALVKFIDRNKLKYYYDDRLKALCVVGNMDNKEKLELSKLTTDENEKLLINELYDLSNTVFLQNSKRYSQEEMEFLKKNEFELHQQILNRWIIHHHNFVLAPINEYSLGRNPNEIYMQYGFLNIIMMKKLLNIFGGINYQNYFKIWYSFYYIYFILFIILAFLLFKRIEYVLIVTMLSFGAFSKISYQLMFLGPGLNPIRHFFDIFIICFLFLYLVKRNNIYYYLTLLFALIGIFNNSQIGFFALIALIFTLIVIFYVEPKERSLGKIIAATSALVVGIISLLFLKVGSDVYSHYYLEGLCGFPVDLKYIVIFLFLLSLGYVTIIKFINKNDYIKYVCIFLLFYSQAMFIYFVWGATKPHLYNFSFVYILTVVAMLKLIINNSIKIKKYENNYAALLVLLSLLYIFPSLYMYYNSKREYDNVFKTHKTYEWNLDRAKFTSTMDPEYFENSISIIQKYSKENGIYIISKYDNFLPFLSKKYSDMPYFDVQWFLITQKEVQECIKKVKTKKPEYLFVDTDINRSLIPDKIPEGLYNIVFLYEESIWRIQRLNLLKDIFSAVKDDYEPVEQGYLITAYKRKQSK